MGRTTDGLSKKSLWSLDAQKVEQIAPDDCCFQSKIILCVPTSIIGKIYNTVIKDLDSNSV